MKTISKKPTVVFKPTLTCSSLPVKAHYDDAAFDLFLAEDIDINPGATNTASLGFSMEMPTGWHAKICLRSGIASKYNVFIPNAPGIIDAGYRGEVRIIISNNDPLSSQSFVRGTKIAQMLIEPVYEVNAVVAEDGEELSNSARGTGGFGSTGEK